MRAIVVGASGYIGSRLLARAAERGDALGTSLAGAAPLVPLDLRRAADFDTARIARNDVVYLAAGISAPDVCASERERAHAVNVEGTSLLIERALDRGARVVFFSSDTVYGQTAVDVDESAPCRPGGEYGRMKHAVEARFSSHAAFKAVRLSYVFSRADQFTRYLLGCASSGALAQVFHPFERAVVHLDDVIEALLALPGRWEDAPAPAINFGGPHVLSRSEIAQVIRDAAAPALTWKLSAPPPAFFVNRPGVIRMRSPHLARLLGRPARSLREAARLEFANRESR